MAKCDTCGTTIVFGGVKDGGYRYCNASCRANDLLREAAESVPEDAIRQHLAQLHQGDCPRCGGPGPVDVHTSYTVWSALAFTTWKERPQVSCRSCGKKAKLGALASSTVLGWRGFPWGLIFTPIQITRNLVGLASSPDPETPSPRLEKVVRLNLASQSREQTPQDEPQP